MLSFARSFAVVLSQNKMIYKFGPDGAIFKAIGGGNDPRHRQSGLACCSCSWPDLRLRLELSRPGAAISTPIGGNEQAARLTGVPVDRVKLQAYVVSGLMAAIAAILIVGWQGSAINALGTGYELRVIASTVIGGANLMGGEGGAYGAVHRRGADRGHPQQPADGRASIPIGKAPSSASSSFSRFCSNRSAGARRD